MSPSAVAERAQALGLDALALCDHNASANVPAYRAAAARRGVAVLGGMEITSREEAHVLGIFGDDGEREKAQLEVFARLPGENDPDRFGLQVVVDENEDVLAFDNHRLIGATTLPLEKVVDLIHEHGGLAVASHVDRQGFSIPGQLGFIPPGLPLDAVEISPRHTPAEALALVPDCARYPVVCSSDAHRLEELGRGWTEMLLEAPTVEEIRLALAGSDGRSVLGCFRRTPEGQRFRNKPP